MSRLCTQHRHSLLGCQRLGLPLHPDKTVGPSTRLIVLGIELDTILQIARLPPTKLQDLKLLLRDWSSRKWCTRVQLESLIGKLHHACLIVWPGRTFLRRMINLLCAFRSRDHPIRLNVEFRLDLLWWIDLLKSGTGRFFSFFLVSCQWLILLLLLMWQVPSDMGPYTANNGPTSIGCQVKGLCQLRTKNCFQS